MVWSIMPFSANVGNSADTIPGAKMINNIVEIKDNSSVKLIIEAAASHVFLREVR